MPLRSGGKHALPFSDAALALSCTEACTQTCPKGTGYRVRRRRKGTASLAFGVLDAASFGRGGWLRSARGVGEDLHLDGGTGTRNHLIAAEQYPDADSNETGPRDPPKGLRIHKLGHGSASSDSKC